MLRTFPIDLISLVVLSLALSIAIADQDISSNIIHLDGGNLWASLIKGGFSRKFLFFFFLMGVIALIGASLPNFYSSAKENTHPMGLSGYLFLTVTYYLFSSSFFIELIYTSEPSSLLFVHGLNLLQAVIIVSISFFFTFNLGMATAACLTLNQKSFSFRLLHLSGCLILSYLLFISFLQILDMSKIP